MKHSRLASIGILAILLAAALFAACSSDDDPSQGQEQQDQQQQPAQRQPAQQSTESSAATSTNEQEADTQSSTSGRAAQQEQAQQREQEAGAAESTSDQSKQDDGQQEQSSVTSAADKDQQDDEGKDSAESDSGDKQSQDQPAQQAEPAQDDEQQADQQQSEQSEQQEREAVQQEDEDNEQEEEQAQPEQSRDPAEGERLRLRAEEIRAEATAPELTGLNGWLNGEETSIALELAKGNVVLIDFWTYTCINCVRTLPFLTAWDEKYRDQGLVILGVHTPEFDFEGIPDNIRGAIAEHGIEYDVPMDNDFRTWRAFNNRFWPAKYLIGPTDDGSPMGIRYFHFGEGHYGETERAIREALEAVGKDLSDIPFGVEVSVPTREGGTPRQTRELYAGWRRNVGGGGPYAGQDAYFLAGPGIDTLYNDIDTSAREHNFWYLEGLWRIEDDAIVHVRQTDDLKDYMALIVRGRTANVVLTVAEDGQPFNVYVELDGRWLFPTEAGSHIQWDDAGRSYIRVTENDLYRLLFLPEWSEHELKLSSDSNQFRIFAFTFGSYVGGE